MKDDILTSIDGTPVTHIGTTGDYDHVYYSEVLNQVYLVDALSGKSMTFTHEEYIKLCDMRETIERIAHENTDKQTQK